jgi:hypothetical protein
MAMSTAAESSWVRTAPERRRQQYPIALLDIPKVVLSSPQWQIAGKKPSTD